MATTTKTKTININGKTVKVMLERGTWIEDIHLDGMLCGTKMHTIDRTEIALYDGSERLAYGSTLKPLPERHPKLAEAKRAGCVGIVGHEWFVKSETADTIRIALAELEAENPKTPEQVELERDKATAKAQAEAWLDSDEYRQMREFERKMDSPNSDL